MRQRNAFKLVGKRIEYADFIKDAVLNPRLDNLNIHLNGGWDWVDSKYGFIKLLLSRGQVAEVTSHSDLLARRDYLEAASLGVAYSPSLAIRFEFKAQTRKTAYASEKRMIEAEARFQAYKQEIETKREVAS